MGLGFGLGLGLGSEFWLGMGLGLGSSSAWVGVTARIGARINLRFKVRVTKNIESLVASTWLADGNSNSSSFFVVEFIHITLFCFAKRFC